MPTILITGGTGTIGNALTKLLVSKGYQVIIVTRSTEGKKPKDGIAYAEWDVQQQTIDKAAITKADYIVHLAGAGVADKRWTDKRKQEIKESRVKSGELLVKALSEYENKVKAVISASAIGWYGEDKKINRGRKAFTEDMPADSGFLGETCRLWEESIRPVEHLGKRLVILRTGIVLSNDGGAFVSFKLPVKFGIAAVLGNGKQEISWVHINDVCSMYLFAIENEISGVFNAVAPHPVTNKELTLQLAQIMKGRFYVPVHVPSLILKIFLGELSIEVLKSATVSSARLSDAGFNFTYPQLSGALKNLVNDQK